MSLTYILALLLPPAAVEDRPPSATVSRCADSGGEDACRPAPRQGLGARRFKRSVPPVPPSFAAAAAVRAPRAVEAHRAPFPPLAGPRLLYLLMSLLC